MAPSDAAPSGAALLARTAELVAIPSVSRHEEELASHVAAALRTCPGLEVTCVGPNVVARTRLGRPVRVVLAGHLDTVPPKDNATPQLDGSTLRGLGSADMKGGLAVMLALAERLETPACDVTYVFYATEEVARAESGLLTVAGEAPHLLDGDVAVLGEPTAALIEAGCQGVLKLDVRLAGRRAHAARPWQGVNAVHRLAAVLERVSTAPQREPVIDGCRYHETLQAVRVEGGVAANVVPDRAAVLLNHRFAPDRTPAESEASLRALLAPVVDPALGDELVVEEAEPGAPPALDHPILTALLRATGQPPRAKLGWTDVAFFSARGIPAVNFGPGDPELAHTAEERVEGEHLVRVYEALRQVLTAGGRR